MAKALPTPRGDILPESAMNWYGGRSATGQKEYPTVLGVSRTAFRINAASFSPRAVQPAQHFLPGPSRQENAGEYCNSRIPTLHQWHADTVDALVLGFTGPRLRPHHLVLAVGDEGGAARVSARLEPVLATRVGEALSGAVVVGERTAGGEPYTRVETDLVVGCWPGRAGDGTLTVVRMR